MIQVGDIHLADLRQKRRWSVFVVSTERFHRLSERVLVAPQVAVADDEVTPPWLVHVGGDVYALHLLRSLPVSRLLDRTGRASPSELERARRALRHIT